MTKILSALAWAALLTACDGGQPAATAPDKPTVASATPAAAIAYGKTGEGPGVAITITSVKQQARIGLAGYGPETAAGESFVIVRYTIKNTSKKPLSSSDRPSVKMLDGAGQTYAQDTDASILAAGLNNDIQDSTNDLNPNVTAKETAVWKLDKASFDKAAWRLEASTGGLGAAFDKAAKWPLNDVDAPPMLFKLK